MSYVTQIFRKESFSFKLRFVGGNFKQTEDAIAVCDELDRPLNTEKTDMLITFPSIKRFWKTQIALRMTLGRGGLPCGRDQSFYYKIGC